DEKRGPSVRMAACVALLASCLALTGCSLLGKKQQGGTAASRQPAGQPPPAARPATADNSAVPAGGEGLLARPVIDPVLHRKPPPVTIQVLLAQDGKAAPVVVHEKVEADANGYFTILNLQPGKQYQLVARAKEGDRKLVGVTWATPPDPRVHVKLK